MSGFMARLVTDAVGHIVDGGPELAQLLNLSERGLRGRLLPTFVIKDRAELIRQLDQAASGSEVSVTTRLKPRDLQPRQVRIEIRRISERPLSLEWVIEVVA
jgi:hypothetical protein